MDQTQTEQNVQLQQDLTIDDQVLGQIIQETEKTYKDTYSFEERYLEYQVIRCNYPGFITIACELENITNIQNKKINFRLYVSEDVLVGHFRHFLRDLLATKITVKKSDKLLILCGDDVIIKHDIHVKEIYSKKVDIDGWLYIKISIES